MMVLSSKEIGDGQAAGCPRRCSRFGTAVKRRGRTSDLTRGDLAGRQEATHARVQSQAGSRRGTVRRVQLSLHRLKGRRPEKARVQSRRCKPKALWRLSSTGMQAGKALIGLRKQEISRTSAMSSRPSAPKAGAGIVAFKAALPAPLPQRSNRSGFARSRRRASSLQAKRPAVSSGAP